MKNKYMSSLGLIMKLIIILALPLLLFSYIDSQPTPVVKEEDDEGTRSVAIVNEDLGYTSGSEDLAFGEDLIDILEEQKDYSWFVMNRRAAEQGFSNQEYDAVFYVPSNFSENVMTFREDSPAKASINYIVEPNLEAKERQRIHKEMAYAKNTINHNMSMIYWSYVSQEVDNIREQFDKILEKEIAFQEAMYSFYTPSSATLANEIDRHKNRLESLLNQTSGVDDASAGIAEHVESTKDTIAQFTEALDAYKESQLTQEQLLNEFQNEKQTLIQDSIDSYNEAIEEKIADIREQFSEQTDLLDNQNVQLQARFESMEGKLEEGQETIVDWRAYTEENQEEQADTLEEITIDIVSIYTGHILEEWVEEADGEFDGALDAFIEAPINAILIDPAKPEEIEKFTFDDLKNIHLALVDAIKVLEEEIEIPEPEDPDNSDDQDESESPDESDILAGIKAIAEALNDQITVLEEKGTHQNTAITHWENYAIKWQENYQAILTKVAEANEIIIDDINDKQEDILDRVSKERREELEAEFTKIDDISNKTTESLVMYANSLSVYQTVINQKANIDEDFVKDILARDNMQERVKELFAIDDRFATDLEDMLGIKENDEQNKADQLKDEEDNFAFLVETAENNLRSSSANIEATIVENRRIMSELNENAKLISDQINNINIETFDWEEPSSVQYLDGQMVFQFHENTASNIENLSGLVASLSENQNNVASETEDLQMTVGSVQEESDRLNDRWSSNVANTEQVKDDVYDVLGNTVVDGQSNPYVYDYLSNPVTIDGQVDGKPLSESEDRMPPIVLFIIILLSGLLIGFLTQYYSSQSYVIQGALFALLTLAVGLIISIYGLNIYTLDDSQAIMWSAFTIVLLMMAANIIRGGLFVGQFIGWLASIVMIMFFITPLLNIVVPEFSFKNPVSQVYMGLMYGSSSTSYTSTMIGMIVTILITSALIYTIQIMRNKTKAEEANEEEAA